MNLQTAADAGKFFESFTGQLEDGSALQMNAALPWLVAVFVFNFWLIYRGLSGGIEKMCNFGMPLLIVLAIVVLVRVLTLGAPNPSRPHDNVWNGLGYMWNPTQVQLLKTHPAKGEKPLVSVIVGEAALTEAKAEVAASNGALQLVIKTPWQQLKNPSLWLAAASQIFFSLSVGFGVIIVYASYLTKKDDVVLSGLTASSANEFCEVALGGLISVPAAVAFLGLASVAGQGTFGLGFTVLPLVFAKMPLGAFFGGLFFFMLFLAAVTSSISMLQPGIAFVEEALGVGRKVSVTLLGLLTAFGCGLVSYFTLQLKALDTMDFWVGQFLIFLLATIQVIVFGWHWGIERGLAEAHQGASMRIPAVFGFILRWLCPAFLLTVFIMWFLKDVTGLNLETMQFGNLSGYVSDLLGEGEKRGNFTARLSVVFVLGVAAFFALLTSRAQAYAKAERGLTKYEPM
jgi:SNF family Na+-dependent transporter